VTQHAVIRHFALTLALALTYLPTTVGAVNALHNGSLDVFVTRLDTKPLPPEPPTLRVTGMTGNVVTVGWTPPAAGLTPTAYLIEGGLLPGQVLGSLPLGTAPSVTITLPTGSFYLRMRTLSNNLVSAPSNEVLVHVNVPVAPSAPANLLGLVVGDTLSLAWTNTFAGGVPTNVILDVSGALSGSAPLGLTDTFSVAGVPPGTYTLTVRATNASGTGVASNPVTLTFPAGCTGAPLPVSNFVAFNVGATLFLSWDTAASGPAPTGYALDVTGSFVGSVPTAMKALSGAVPPGTYNVAVTASNACGASAATPVQTVTIP
jgi:surface-anchored protein